MLERAAEEKDDVYVCAHFCEMCRKNWEHHVFLLPGALRCRLKRRARCTECLKRLAFEFRFKTAPPLPVPVTLEEEIQAQEA